MIDGDILYSCFITYLCYIIMTVLYHVWIQRGAGPSLKNYKNIGFLSNTGLDSLKNHKATNSAFNVGLPLAPSAKHHLIAYPCRANGCLLIVVFRSSHQLKTKKKFSKLDPL